MRVRVLSRRNFMQLAATSGALAACGDSTGEDTSNLGDGSGSGDGSGDGAGGDGAGGDGAGGGPGTIANTGEGFEPTEAWKAPGDLDSSAFAWGVQTGDALPTSVLLSARTTEVSVLLTVMVGVKDGWEEVSSGQALSPTDGVVHLQLEQLAVDTTYAVVFHTPDRARRSRVARFRTAIHPDANRTIRFGAASCFGDSNLPWPNVSHSVPEKLDFMMMLGDTIYGDNNPNGFEYVKKFKTALSTKGLNDLTAGTSMIATWDDHEVDNDWTWDDPGIVARHAEALAAFEQAIPHGKGSGGTIWRKISWGQTLDVFVLDLRSERDDDHIMSTEQMEWLKKGLSESKAAFKIIANSVPIFDYADTGIGKLGASGRWQGFPTQRREILTHIRDNKVAGVLWVSGDVHYGAIGQVDAPGGPGDDQWDLIAGPAGSPKNLLANLLKKGPRVPVVRKDWNWVLLEADPVARSIKVQFIGDDGSTMDEHTFQLG